MTRAFSLVEVLIGVVVLALGLIGLAAVFPVVVTQQRQTADAVQGVSIERSMMDYMEAHERMSRDVDVDGDGTIQPIERSMWKRLLATPAWSPVGQWTVPGGGGTIALDPVTGEMTYGSGGGIVSLPLIERLVPRPNTMEDVPPRYVWDMAVRRDIGFGRTARTTDTNYDPVEVVVFVRRIDTGIRVRSGETLSMLLTGLDRSGNPLTNERRRVPVAVDASGRPTYDGRGATNAPNYSTINSFEYTLWTPPGGTAWANRIVIEPNTPDALQPFIRQIGQKFVDDEGEVHTVTDVIRTPAGAIESLQIEPGVSPRMAAQFGQVGRPLQMLYTPQIPASVGVKSIVP